MSAKWWRRYFQIVAIFLIDYASFASATATTDRKIVLHLPHGQSILATARFPTSLPKGKKIPAFLIFGGFESAAHVLDLIHPDIPVALASFDYPFTGSRTLRLRDAFMILHEAKSVQPVTVNGILALVQWLQKIPEIDPHRIIVIGASFGAPFALAAAARDRDISGVVLVHAFGDVPDTAEHVILRSWLPKYGWPSRPLAWLISHFAWDYLGLESPEADSRMLKPGQRVLMITAKDDSFIPRRSSDSLWTAIRQSRAESARILMPGDHLMPGADRLIRQIMCEVENWEQAECPRREFRFQAADRARKPGCFQE